MKTSIFFCRKCKSQLKDIPESFDAFSFINKIIKMYCDNKDCEWFGLVTVAGVKETEVTN